MLRRFTMRRFTGLAVGALLLVVLYARGSLRPGPLAAREPRPPIEVARQSPFVFHQEAAALGLAYRHQLYYPNRRAGSYLPLMALPPAIAVADLDGDGFYDIYVTQPDPALPNRLFHNIAGHHFEAAGTGLTKSSDADSVPLVFDVDGDGRLDIVQTRFGCHTLFLQGETPLSFVEHSERFGGYCSNPKGVNFADFNRDGVVDLVFANYYPTTPLSSYLPLNHVFGYAGADYDGGLSEVVFGRGGGFGARVGLLSSGALRRHAQAVGVSDIDHDGFPDIYLASDYYFDGLFMNRGGSEFVDESAKWLPRQEHGFSGMDVDFGDFDNTGQLGIYVSNMHIPPFVQTGNLLWQREGDHFRNVAAERGVKRCGWAWSGKFADFANRGALDLFVINGKARGRLARSPKDAFRSFAFIRNTISTLPLQLRWDISLYPPFDHFVMSGFEPSCLFWNRDGHFYDVAEPSGIDDLGEGQAGALIDYDNDGRIDLVVANMGEELLLYHNVTPHPGGWVGLLPLWGRAQKSIAYGARLTLHRADGKRTLVELYPANGYRGQSDPRIHFGLGAATEVAPIEVEWPDRRRELFEGLQINRYQSILYGTGRPL